MRGYYSIIMLTMLCTLVSCKTTQLHSVGSAEPQRPAPVVQEQPRPVMAGGYTDYREPTAEDLRIFQTTYSGEQNLKPLRVASQIVAGRNFRFCCQDEQGREVIVTIHQPLPGRGDPYVLKITK